MQIRIEGMTHRYGDVTAVSDLSLTIDEGEFLVLLGPSGCGKTSTMRCIVGLETPARGRISFGDRVVFDADRRVDVPANQRGAGMVFQSYAIWPHKTVFENVAFPLQMQRVSREEARTRVAEALEMVGLEGYEDRGASALSGGQMQRVALARSVVTRPTVLLLDEPLSNLDAKLRERLRVELREIQQALGITTVYVTHDQSEALALADRIAVMNEGVMIRLDDPVSLYRHPGSRFVASFLGSSNLLEGTVIESRPDGCDVRLHQVPVVLQSVDPATEGAEVTVSVRPEDILIVETEASVPKSVCKATVEVTNFLGSQVHYLVRTEHGAKLEVMAGPHGMVHGPGAVLALALPPDRVQLLTS